MPATDSSVTRETDVSGDEIHTYTADDSSRVQSMALNPEIMGELLATGRTNATAVIQTEAKSGAGRLFRAEVVGIAGGFAGDRWLMVVDKGSAAVNNDLPILRSPRLVGDFGSIDLGLYGQEFTLGCQLVLSTSPADVQLAPAEGFFQWATD
jgi:hypothetical protein